MAVDPGNLADERGQRYTLPCDHLGQLGAEIGRRSSPGRPFFMPSIPQALATGARLSILGPGYRALFVAWTGVAVGDGMTDRREVLRAVAGLSIAGTLPALAGCSGGSAAFGQPVVQPNIVFIMADDLGYADLGCYGQRAYATPRIDALAAGGVRLTQGYANSCVCSATRTALATGRYQYRVHGRAAGADQRRQSPVHARLPGHPTIASLLRGLGYRTALVGKWHIGTSPAAGPNNYGYDHFFGYTGGGTSYYPLPPGDPRPDEILRNGDPAAWNGYLTDVLGDEAVGWIGAGGPSRSSSASISAPRTSRGPRRATWPARCNGPTRSTATAAISRSTARSSARSTRTSAKCSTRSPASASPTTRSWCSPATTAASASPRCGRSPGSRASCSKAASACR